MKKGRSVGCVLAAGTLWGCMGILVRTMKEGGFDSLEVTAFRSFVTTLVMAVGMSVFKREELKIRWKDIWCFLGTGILSVTFFNVCYFSCMNLTTLSVAAILLYTAPSFVILMSAVLFKEKLGLQKLAALVLSFLGCVLVSGGLQGAGISMAGLLTGLGAGFGYALYSIFGKFAIQKGYSSYTITTYTFLFAGIGTLPFIDMGHLSGCLKTSGRMLPTALLLAIITTVVAYLLYTAGLKGLENGKASIIASVEPVVASVVGFLLYQEAISPMGALGMALVLFSCFLAGA